MDDKIHVRAEMWRSEGEWTISISGSKWLMSDFIKSLNGKQLTMISSTYSGENGPDSVQFGVRKKEWG